MKNIKKMLIASKNDEKIKQIKAIMKRCNIELLTYKDVPFSDVVEDGENCIDNAIKKATQVAKETGYVTISDDSGLFVNSLGGAPGHYAARYAGENATDKQNNSKLLKALHGHLDRKCRFLCVICVVSEQGKYKLFEGEIYGEISTKEVGSHGSSYDTVFYLPEFKKTLAEMGEDAYGLSHRAIALEKMIEELFPEVYDEVNSPSHYDLKDLGIQAIDVIKSVTGDGFDDYCIGNVLKYVIRAKHKNGTEDYMKARKYLDFILEDEKNEV